MGIASIEEKINKCPFSGSVVDFIDHSYGIGSSSGYYYLDYHFNSHTYKTSCRDISRKLAFDHYFATYPNAANPSSEPAFSHSPYTPSINGLAAGLLTNNTNLANPFRLDRSQSVIVTSCNPAHKYTLLQKSFDGGLMDKFVQNSGLS